LSYTKDFNRAIWDCLDAHTFVEALSGWLDRIQTDITAFRINQSGDLRHRGDLVKLSHIAEVLSDERDIDTYLYTASDYLDYSYLSDAVTVNMSNPFFDNAASERFSHYTALPEGVAPEDIDQLDDDAVHCPYDRSGGEIHCGDCRLCIDQNDVDVYIRQH